MGLAHKGYFSPSPPSSSKWVLSRKGGHLEKVIFLNENPPVIRRRIFSILSSLISEDVVVDRNYTQTDYHCHRIFHTILWLSYHFF